MIYHVCDFVAFSRLVGCGVFTQLVKQLITRVYSTRTGQSLKRFLQVVVHPTEPQILHTGDPGC